MSVIRSYSNYIPYFSDASCELIVTSNAICHPAGVSSRAASGAGPSGFKQALLKALGPAPEAARDDTPASQQTLFAVAALIKSHLSFTQLFSGAFPMKFFNPQQFWRFNNITHNPYIHLILESRLCYPPEKSYPN
jgi:hypothetical protein